MTSSDHGASKTGNLTRDEARRRAEIISGLTYEVRLDFTAGDETFPTETSIRFGCSEPGAETFLDYSAPHLDRITLNGREIDPAAFDGDRIALPGLEEHNEVVVAGLSAYNSTGVGMHRFVDPVDGAVYLHSDYEPFDAHRVFPCFDQPDLKATFDFTVQAPVGWTVISNNAPAAQPPAGEGVSGEAGRMSGEAGRIWSFGPTPKMSTYITAVIAGEYHGVRDTHRNIGLGLFCRKSLASYLDHEEFFEITKQGFDFFEETFGYPYPFGKYDQIIVPEFNAGAMENAGAVTFNEFYLFRSKVTEATRERRAETILHEMAHMWFGDLVTMRWWDDLWLNESFATFASVVAQISATRFRSGWTTFCNGMKLWAYLQDQMPTTHPITADIPDVDSTKVYFDGISYAKGASVLRQLVAWVGEEPFFEGLRNYFRKHEFSNTDLGDFLAAIEEASGRDLRAWSKDWLETAGVNTLRAEYRTRRDGGGEVFDSFAIVQEAPDEWPTFRPHRAGVGLYEMRDGRLVKTRNVEADVSGPRTELPGLAGAPVPDLILPNDGDLAYAKVRFDPRSWATVTEHLGDLDDSLARALCWTAGWDMVRDAELASSDYVDLVLKNIGGETDISIVQLLLNSQTRTLAEGKGLVATAAAIFGAPSSYKDSFSRLARASHENLATEQPGSDRQLTWAKSFIASAIDPQDFGTLLGLLEGSIAFDGLAIDVDLRWQAVATLVGRGADGAALAEAELERDSTDAGKRNLEACLASRPSAEAKAQAWSKLFADPHPPLATMRAIMGADARGLPGFHRFDQVDLLRPYAEPYFQALPKVWDEWSHEVALAFTSGMYPRTIIDPETVEMTDRFLQDHAPSFAARRLLLEGRDTTLRAIKARAKDASK
jgi:aminopeptidase N